MWTKKVSFVNYNYFLKITEFYHQCKFWITVQSSFWSEKVFIIVNLIQKCSPHTYPTFSTALFKLFRKLATKSISLKNLFKSLKHSIWITVPITTTRFNSPFHCDRNGAWTHNYLFGKLTLNHLAKLTKGLYCE